MFESIFLLIDEAAFSVTSILACLSVAIGVGLLLSFTYHTAGSSARSSTSLAMTIVLLPAVICVIILLVGNNSARAFSLAGAFSIIRFRSEAGEPKDILYVLFSMAVGLACGMGYLLFGAFTGALLCGALYILEKVRFGQIKGMRLIKLTVPEDLDFENEFDEVFAKYTMRYELKRVRTVQMGSLYELSYYVTLASGVSLKEFVDELRIRNSNLSISFSLDVND